MEEIINNVLPDFSFDFIIGQSDKYPLKPDPESLMSMMRHYGADRSSTLYVGDSEVDYLTAKNAEVESIIVNYGFRTKEELEKSGVKETVDDAYTLLKRIELFFHK